MKNKFLIYLDFILYYLLLFIPLGLISGPFIADLLVSISSIIFLIIVSIKGLKIIKHQNILILCIIVYLLIILSSLLSEHPSYSIKTTMPYIRIFILIFSIFYVIENSKYEFLKSLQISFFFIYLFLSVDTLFQVFEGKTILGLARYNERTSGIFGEELVLGGFVVRSIPIYISLFFFNYNLFNKLFNNLQKIVIFNTLLIIFFTGERTAFLLSIILFITMFVCLRRELIKFFLLFFLISFTIFINLNYAKNLTERYAFLNPSKTSQIIFNSPYILHYKNAFLIFKDNPLTGVGPNNFNKTCNNLYKNGCATHPHNIYMEILAETGFIIFLILFVIYIYILIEYIKLLLKSFYKKKIKNYLPKLFIITSLIINFFPIIGSGSIFNNWFAILLFFPIGIYLSIYENK